MDPVRKHFFISYNHADEQWAQWIAHVLEDAGYSVIIQAWDFRPGSNFVLEMERALQLSDRMIAVLSLDYLQARYPQPEWAAAFAGDPEGVERSLVPVMVRECEPRGLLGQVVQIRIHKLPAAEAERAILEGVETTRAKPSTRPSFPGVPGDASVLEPTARPAVPLRWHQVDAPVQVRWRTDLDGCFPGDRGAETVELHLVPVGVEARLQVCDLAHLRDVLPDFGRQHRMFSPLEQLTVHADADRVSVVSAQRESSGGLAVTRAGQRSAWTALPRGQMSAILDEEHLAGQIQAMLRALAALELAGSDLVVPAVAIEPAMMITVAKVSAQPSNVATFGHGMPERVRPAHDDAVALADVATHAAAIGAELAARLATEHRTAARLR